MFTDSYKYNLNYYINKDNNNNNFKLKILKLNYQTLFKKICTNVIVTSLI